VREKISKKKGIRDLGGPLNENKVRTPAEEGGF